MVFVHYIGGTTQIDGVYITLDCVFLRWNTGEEVNKNAGSGATVGSDGVHRVR